MDERQRAGSRRGELLMERLISLWTRRPFTAFYVTHICRGVRCGHKIVGRVAPSEIREVVDLTTRWQSAPMATPPLRAQQHLWG